MVGIKPSASSPTPSTISARSRVTIMWWMLAAIVSTPTLMLWRASQGAGGLAIRGDTLWHLRAGQWMWVHHRLPATALWAWPLHGVPWINIEWGFDAISAGLVHLFGLSGLWFWALWASAGIIVGQTARLAARPAPSRVIVGALTAAVVLLLMGHWRPQLVSYGLWPIWLAVLMQSRHGVRRLWLLPPLLVLWVNLHGGYLLALMATATWAVVTWRQGQWPVGAWKPLVALALAVFLTPYGGGAVAHAIWESHNSLIRQTIVEWQSPSFHQPFWLLALGLPVLAIAVFWYLDPLFLKRMGPLPWLWWAMTLAATLVAQRNVAFFWIETFAVLGQSGALDTAVRFPPKGWAMGLTGLALLSWPGVVPSTVTVSAALPPSFVQTLHHKPGRIWNSYRLGDRLIWHDLSPSLDGRTDLYVAHPAVYRHTLAMLDGTVPYPQLLAYWHQEHVRWVMVSTSRPIAQEILGRGLSCQTQPGIVLCRVSRTI